MFVGSNVANQRKKVKNDENILPTRQNHKDSANFQVEVDPDSN